ncbi:hypothetical protein BB559_001796 [Furculomyces boomerangus]|uniref:Homeobox domain-containing protein n=2 Tax=Harpellales TaxID=61421 RepID=A0A2T9YCN8_9FUNG|nr:hypothetical protein BB559_004800 [Furculomyces boomerangus]PVU98074.1 hypothetical protein BB559_001796 [Furculomyces boomerangus]PWA02894.1 hypothetical protein BB558_000938 [Smittium angustum]
MSELKTNFYNPYQVKHRRRTTKEQFQILESTFIADNKPSAETRRDIAQKLSMTPREVQVWFQNRRAKEKNLLNKPETPVSPNPCNSQSLGINSRPLQYPRPENPNIKRSISESINSTLQNNVNARVFYERFDGSAVAPVQPDYSELTIKQNDNFSLGHGFASHTAQTHSAPPPPRYGRVFSASYSSNPNQINRPLTNYQRNTAKPEITNQEYQFENLNRYTDQRPAEITNQNQDIISDLNNYGIYQNQLEENKINTNNQNTNINAYENNTNVSGNPANNNQYFLQNQGYYNAQNFDQGQMNLSNINYGLFALDFSQIGSGNVNYPNAPQTEMTTTSNTRDVKSERESSNEYNEILNPSLHNNRLLFSPRINPQTNPRGPNELNENINDQKNTNRVNPYLPYMYEPKKDSALAAEYNYEEQNYREPRNRNTDGFQKNLNQIIQLGGFNDNQDTNTTGGGAEVYEGDYLKFDDNKNSIKRSMEDLLIGSNERKENVKLGAPRNVPLDTQGKWNKEKINFPQEDASSGKRYLDNKERNRINQRTSQSSGSFMPESGSNEMKSFMSSRDFRRPLGELVGYPGQIQQNYTEIYGQQSIVSSIPTAYGFHEQQSYRMGEQIREIDEERSGGSENDSDLGGQR